MFAVSSIFLDLSPGRNRIGLAAHPWALSRSEFPVTSITKKLGGLETS
jgi:hypothetical protein